MVKSALNAGLGDLSFCTRLASRLQHTGTLTSIGIGIEMLGSISLSNARDQDRHGETAWRNPLWLRPWPIRAFVPGLRVCFGMVISFEFGPGELAWIGMGDMGGSIKDICMMKVTNEPIPILQFPCSFFKQRMVTIMATLHFTCHHDIRHTKCTST